MALPPTRSHSQLHVRQGARPARLPGAGAPVRYCGPLLCPFQNVWTCATADEENGDDHVALLENSDISTESYVERSTPRTTLRNVRAMAATQLRCNLSNSGKTSLGRVARERFLGVRPLGCARDRQCLIKFRVNPCNYQLTRTALERNFEDAALPQRFGANSPHGAQLYLSLSIKLYLSTTLALRSFINSTCLCLGSAPRCSLRWPRQTLAFRAHSISIHVESHSLQRLIKRSISGVRKMHLRSKVLALGLVWAHSVFASAWHCLNRLRCMLNCSSCGHISKAT